LTNTEFDNSGFNWSRTGDCVFQSVGGNNQTNCTYSSGAGSISQAYQNFSTAVIGDRWYRIRYYVNSSTYTDSRNGYATAIIGQTFATAGSNLILTPGQKESFFKTRELSNQIFRLTVTLLAGQSVILENVTIDLVTSGGNYTGGGLTGIVIDPSGNVTFPYNTTSDNIYANSITSNNIYANGNRVIDSSMRKFYILNNNASTVSTTIVNSPITILLSANKNYTIDCQISFECNSSTGGFGMALNGSTSATNLFYNMVIATSGTAASRSSKLAYEQSAKSTDSIANAPLPANLNGIIINGASDSTLTLQYLADTTNGTKIIKGSYCIAKELVV
jgi:hypothetical protein